MHWKDFDLGEKHPFFLYKPIPAEKMLPDWFKRLESGDSIKKTAKTCKGLYDIIASGYLVLWPFDAKIEKNEEGKLIIFKSRTGTNEDFSPHPHYQIDGYPDQLLESQADGVQKLNSPYVLKSPPGTSILVKQPSYRPELRTEVMEGIIDTDQYYGDFNVLFMIKKTKSDRPISIKAGTPLAQIIPFVRGDWSIKYDSIDEKELEIFNAYAYNIDKFYQKHMWERKVFKDEAN